MAVTRWCHIPKVEIAAVCDVSKEVAEEVARHVEQLGKPRPKVYWGETAYKDLCRQQGVNLVYVCTDWMSHVPIAIHAMEQGRSVAVEVPAALTLKDIWKLIDTAEQTRQHCMMLENCCYDFFELNSLNMAQKDVFGEILYVQGAYRHELSKFWDAYWKKDAQDKLGWRLDYNQKFRGDVYASHGLGPIAQVLNIHRGDKMNTLVAMDTKSVNGKKQVEKMTGEPCKEFRNGDQTTTLISTENGKVIEIHHNVMTPQPYNRMYQLTGTKGFANKYPFEGFALSAEEMKKSGVTPSSDNLSGHSYLSQVDTKALIEKYESPIVAKYEKQAKEVGGHGGMDFIMDSRLVYCLQNGLPLDIDVYDLAEWCCLAELGSISMDNGNIPVEVPDFTRGEWNKVKGFHHAYASPTDEAQAAKDAMDFTTKLKEKGKKYWEKTDKAAKKK